MIIIPDGAPRATTDYEGAWSSLSRRTRRVIVAAAPIPVGLGILPLIVQDATVTEFAIVVAFAIWGSIGGYLGLVSDNRRIARRREKRQFRPLANAETDRGQASRRGLRRPTQGGNRGNEEPAPTVELDPRRPVWNQGVTSSRSTA